MNQHPFIEVVKEICAKDERYTVDAYFFVRDALDYTTHSLQRSPEGSDAQKHVSGQELLAGIRQFALKEFGPITLMTLNSWGIKKTEDFGEIVFNLVESGKLGCTEEDRKEDFANGYDFKEAFDTPFVPEGKSTKEDDS